jgi:transposase, IS5 family
MRQKTLAEGGFENYRKATRRERFLEEMEQVVPWQRLVRLVEPHYPKGEGPGRPPVGIERMLRIYCLQQCFNLSDPGVEEAMYDSNAMRRFVGIDLGREPAPDETTVCKFRHLIERQGLAQKMFRSVNRYLSERGLRLSSGSIVDATIIQAPSSTKNKENKRDPEMHQTRKGNQWYFGMKAHIGVDSRTRLIHSVATTPANVHDSQMLEHLLHGHETRVWGDSAYTGQHERMLSKAPYAQDFTNRKGTRNKPLSEADRARNRTKSKVRARVEHPFLVIKQVFGFVKMRYRGLMKNTSRIHMLCALTNLYMARRRLLRLQAA